VNRREIEKEVTAISLSIILGSVIGLTIIIIIDFLF
jgi:hypothetical protein